MNDEGNCKNGAPRPLRFGKAGRLRHRSLVEGLFADGQGNVRFSAADGMAPYVRSGDGIIVP